MNDRFSALTQLRPYSESGLTHSPVVYVKEKTMWEYKQVIRSLAEEETLTEDELNVLGNDGWELAGILAATPLVHFYFKRLAE